VLDHCGKQLEPRISVSYVSKDELGRSEAEWLKERGEKGFAFLTADTRMVADHDIAALAIKHGIKVFILAKEASQQRRWHLLKWFAIHMPKIAYAATRCTPGSTFLVNYKGAMTIVLPTEPPKFDQNAKPEPAT